MTRHVLLACTAIAAFSFASTNCRAQTIRQFNPNVTSIEQIDQFSETTVPVVTNSSRSVRIESHVLRNTLVIAALGLTFSLGMAITATTIRQNRPSTPRPASYYSS